MKNIVLLFAILISGFVKGQQKMLTMEEAVIKGRTTLAPKTLRQLMWIKQSELYSYVDTEKGQERLYVAKADKNQPEIIVSLSDINTALRTNNEDTLGNFPSIEWEDLNSFTFKANKKRKLWVVASKALENKELENFPTDAEHIDKDNRKGIIAFTKENNLMLWNAGKVFKITNEANKYIINGQSVHRNEFGIKKGTFWSPSGSYLAFYRMDESMVADYPITGFNQVPASTKVIKYPMSGDTSHQVTIGVFDLKNLKIIFLKTPPPADHYLTNISWSPDDKIIYVAELNREQQHMKLNAYNPLTGDFIKTLFEEKDTKYVEPQNPLVYSPANSTRFIWQSNRDGYNHLYLYENSGKLIRQLTKGEWDVTDFLGFDLKGDVAYYTATAESPLNRDVYSVSLVDGKINRLTEGEGTHKPIMNADRTAFLDIFSSLQVPNLISVNSTRGRKLKELLRAEDPLKSYKTSKPSIFNITNKSGTKLFCRMFRPADFDSTKRYPVVVYLYGGPHIQTITNSWQGGANLWFQFMAQCGYLVFTLDNRGSPFRGKSFEQSTFRQLGTVEMEDQLTGLKYLKGLSYVDTARLGVHGWSYGGFMTTSLMTRYPDAFKVGVAGGPVIDWSMYEIMYTERYMDTPAENKAGYEANNLLNHVEKLKGKLLMIHGTDDDVVVWQHSIKFVKTAVDKNIQLDYFVYPGHPHNVQGKDRVHLMNKISNYFFEHL